VEVTAAEIGVPTEIAAEIAAPTVARAVGMISIVAQNPLSRSIAPSFPSRTV
jgi:hypothetical protein